jgi:hypothetical protein
MATQQPYLAPTAVNNPVMAVKRFRATNHFAYPGKRTAGAKSNRG